MKKEGKEYRVYSCDLSNSYIHNKNTSIEQYVEVAANYLGSIIEKDDLTEVVIVGHSMGGLVAGLIAGKFPQIRTVVSIGTPWYGAELLDVLPVSLLSKISVRHNQMRPKSQFLAHVRAVMLAANRSLICIGSKYDYQVLIKSVHMNGANIINLATSYGHTGMILAPSTWNIIMSYLS
jgi:pimeloyl-ACP methyl ester carboxylesterase